MSASTDPETPATALEHALRYAALGLRVVPIKPGQKYPGLKAWQDAATDNPETIRNWWHGLYRGHGVGLALGPQPCGINLFAIDIDVADDVDVDGYTTLDAWETEHGELPETWMAITGNGGAHLIYTAPADVEVRNQQSAGQRIGPGVDIRGAGGQIVVAPTIHPATGNAYIWEDPPWGPTPVAAAPAALLDYVAEPAATVEAAEPAATPADSRPFVVPTNTPPPPRTHNTDDGDTPADWLRHNWDWAHELEAAGWTLARTQGTETYWVRPGKHPRDGHSAVLHGTDGPLVVFSDDTTLTVHHQAGRPTTDGSGSTLTPLQWVAATRHHGNISEASRAIRARMPHTRPPTPTIPVGVDPETGEILNPAAPPGRDRRNLPEEFWEASETLAHIRRAAHARTTSADSTLLATLCRVAALTPHTLELPAVVRSTASLNFLAGLVGPSGAGKTSAVRIAAELLPQIERHKQIVFENVGSGEGLIDSYFEMVPKDPENPKSPKEKRQTKHGAFFYADEGQVLQKIGGRDSSTLMPTLRTAWSGDQLGQANAGVETYRKLKARNYRFVLLAGFQPEYAHALLADSEGGTPQRFVFAYTLDPAIPEEPVGFPGPLPFTPPPNIGGELVDVEAEIAGQVRAKNLAVNRGEAPAGGLDSHADLVRLKVAALLSILHGSTSVDSDGWELAGILMETSNAIRTWVIEVHRSEMRRSEEQRNQAFVRREVAIADSAEGKAIQSGARTISRRVHKLGGVAARWRDVVTAPSSKMRGLASIEDMLDAAIEHGWIVAENVEPEHRQDDGRRWLPGSSKPS